MRISQKTKAILTTIGSCFFYLVLGSSYIWGNISIYVISYYREVTSEITSIIFPMSSILSTFAMWLSFPVAKYLGYNFTLILATILIFTFLFISSFCGEFWIFFIFFGVLYGSSTGLLYLTLLYNTYKYYPHNRGLIGGIVMGVYGISSFISNFLLLGIMNPNGVKAIQDKATGDYYFPLEIAENLPFALKILSLYFMIVMIIGILLNFEYEDPDDPKHLLEEACLELIPIDSQQSITHENPSKSHHKSLIKSFIDASRRSQLKNVWSQSSIDMHDEKKCKSLTEAFKSRVFYIIFIMAYLSSSYGFFIATNFKTYGISKISDDAFLTLVGSMGSLFNGGGRFLWGLVSDKMEFKQVYMIILIIQIFDILTLRFIADYKVLYLIWVCLALLCEGGHFVIFPPLCLKVFGPEVGSKVYSIIILAIVGGNWTQYGVNLLMISHIGFENELFIYFGFTLIAFVICKICKLIFIK